MWQRVESLTGTEGLQILTNSTVAVVGVGSLGSWTAVLLAMSGIGRFILIDPDILEEHNVVRHAADLRYVNQPKVAAVKDLILHRNPLVDVQTFEVDARTIPDVLQSVDLVIVCGLGSEIATSQLGSLIRDLGVPALYGGLYDKAVAGEIFFVTNEEDEPCYGCFASILREQEPERIVKRVANYGVPLDEVKAVPGLGIHVQGVAHVLADWAIRRLLNNNAILEQFSSNLVILSNSKYQAGTDSDGNPFVMEPASSYWVTISRNRGCLLCGLDSSQDSGSIDDLLQ